MIPLIRSFVVKWSSFVVDNTFQLNEVVEFQAVKGGPLSEVISAGRLRVANIFFRDRITACDVMSSDT